MKGLRIGKPGRSRKRRVEHCIEVEGQMATHLFGPQTDVSWTLECPVDTGRRRKINHIIGLSLDSGVPCRHGEKKAN